MAGQDATTWQNVDAFGRMCITDALENRQFDAWERELLDPDSADRQLDEYLGVVR